MQLAELEITDFRGIRYLKVDFRDEFGRVVERLPIVGPNTTGKTSILDAISLCLMPVTEIVQLREGLTLSTPSIVRRGALKARVTCALRFDEEEIDAAFDVFERVESPYRDRAKPPREVRIHWEFPDRTGKYRTGFSRAEPRDGWVLLKARVTAARFLHAPGISSKYFQRLGGVFLFDQQRTGLRQAVTPYDEALLGRIAPLEYADVVQSHPPEEAGSASPIEAGVRESHVVESPREILLTLAARAAARQDSKATDRARWERLCELYAQVCAPNRICGLYNTSEGLDMEFEGDGGLHRYDGLSSGQEMILLLLLQFATKQIHRSVVLIDELELHLHPLWQQRLYQALSQLGRENQIIFTTHSTHLRDLIGAPVIHTGDLEQSGPLQPAIHA